MGFPNTLACTTTKEYHDSCHLTKKIYTLYAYAPHSMSPLPHTHLHPYSHPTAPFTCTMMMSFCAALWKAIAVFCGALRLDCISLV